MKPPADRWVSRADVTSSGWTASILRQAARFCWNILVAIRAVPVSSSVTGIQDESAPEYAVSHLIVVVILTATELLQSLPQDTVR